MKQKIYIGLFAVLVLAYLGLNLFVNPTQATLTHYHISLGHAKLLTDSVVIIISLIYTVGAYGSIKMKQYSTLIKSSKDGRYLDRLSDGLLLLVLAQAAGSASAGLVALIARHELSWLPTLTIINNYLVLVLNGISLAVIALSARSLLSLVPRKKSGYEKHVMMFIFIALSSVYSYLIINQPIHTSLARRAYYMPDWLVLITIAIPYLYVWYMGFWGAYQLFNYQKLVKGSIYKNSLVYVATGLALVVLSSVAVRFLATISAQISRLKITPVLFIIYGFLVLVGVGFVFITLGARKLRRIEEV